MEHFELRKKDIGRIRRLWEELNRINEAESTCFGDFHSGLTFESRTEALSETPDDQFRIFCFGSEEEVVGYCIASVRRHIGDIESLFVSEETRNGGIGSELLRKSKNWLRSKGCSKIILSVAFGHESVFPFYVKRGFLPRTTYFEFKE